MIKKVYILNLTPIADNNRVLAFTSEALAKETLKKAVERMKTLYPKLTVSEYDKDTDHPEYFFYEDGQFCQDIVFRMTAVPMMSEIYPAVEATYFNEWENRQVVDAWPTTDDCDENGRSVALIDPDDKVVTYKEGTDGENCVNVYNIIEDWAMLERQDEEKEIAEKTATKDND